MYAIQGKDKLDDEWVFCTGKQDLPDLFYTEEMALEEYEEWCKSTPEWEYRIVKVCLSVVEE